MPKKNKRKDKNAGKPKHGDGVSTANRTDVQYLENPVKPETDDNEYRVIKLPNGLVALLIACPSDDISSDRDNFHTGNKTDNGDESMAHEQMENGRENYPKWYKKAEIHNERCYSSEICRLCINVGNFSDPRQVPGVSRLLSSTFIEPVFRKDVELSDDYKKLTKYYDLENKIINDSETTIFGFRVTPHVFREAIDLLAQSFVCSLTTRHDIEMKREVLEKQYYGILEHSWAIEGKDGEYIFSQLVASRHPARTFGKHYLKNVCQLSDDKVYKEVLKFRKRHYSANRMTVVIKAKLPLDTLENYAKECFSKIPSNGLPPQNFDPYNFANSFENAKFRRIWITPTIDDSVQEIKVNWIMPPSNWLYRTKTLEYLGWIFKHRGAGSLMSYMEKKKWAKLCQGGVSKYDPMNNSVYSIFSVYIALTKEGNDNKIKVLDALYSYVNMLKQEGPQKRIYDEIRVIEDAKFRYDKYDSWSDHDCKQLSVDMHLYPSVDYLTGPLLYYEYDPVSITTCMNLMTPTKACIIVNDDNFGEQIDKKSFVPSNENYASTAIPEDWIERWKMIEPFPDLKLPKVNVFCFDDLTLIDAPKILTKYPVKVYSDGMSEVWYKFDAICRVPKCHMNFCYVSPLSTDSLENRTMLDLYVAVVQHLMFDELYTATLAGLEYRIKPSNVGLLIEVNGFSQKLPLLTQTIAKYIPESRNLVTKCLFETKKKQLLEGYVKVFSECRASVGDIRLSILRPGHWTIPDKHAALSAIKFDDFQHFMKKFVDHVYIKCLVQGNITEADATENARKFVETSKCGSLLPNTMPQWRKNEIPRGKRCCKVISFHPYMVSYIQNYYQFDDSSIKLSVMIDLFIMFLTDYRFSELQWKNGSKTRNWCVVTRDNFGVNNYTLTYDDFGRSTLDSETIALREDKLEEQRKSIAELSKDFSDDEWRCVKKILTESKRETIADLKTEFSRNWREIILGDYAFDRLSRELDVISVLEAKDFREWMSIITKDDFNVRKLSVQVIIGKYVQTNSSSVKAEEPKNSNAKTTSTNSPHYQLKYIIEYPKGKEEMPHYYITDIEKYKSGLRVLPN